MIQENIKLSEYLSSRHHGNCSTNTEIIVLTFAENTTENILLVNAKRNYNFQMITKKLFEIITLFIT